MYPPLGKVRIAAPLHMSLDTIRVFAISKLSWIKQQQIKLCTQERETPREYLDRESHYVWGKRHLLKVVVEDATPEVSLGHRRLQLRVRPGTDREAKQGVVDQWYRARVKDVVVRLVATWAPLMGVQVERIFVQQMKTKWGSCHHIRRHIRRNTKLAMKPRRCLEYIVVHELPNWQLRREQLNQLPVRHSEWEY